MTSADPGLVLCGVDGTHDARSVVTAAKATAERVGSPLLLLHSLRSTWDASVPAFKDDHGTARFVTHGPPGPALIAAAHRRDASLLVVGTRGPDRRSRLPWGSVSRHVARRARCPVMIVPPSANPEAPGSGSHIVCLVQGAPDESVIAAAAGVARRFDARLLVLHHVEHSDHTADRVMCDRAQELAGDIELETRVVRDDACAAVSAVSEQAALVVAGAPGQRRHGASVSLALTQSALVPVVLCRRDT